MTTTQSKYAAVRDAADALITSLEALPGKSADAGDIASVIERLSLVARTSRDISSDQSKVLYQILGGHSADVHSEDGNVYDVQINVRQDRKDWKHKEVARRIAAQAAPRQPKAAERVADAIVESAGVSYWRVRELRGRGIEPDLYATVERGAPEVKVTRKDA